MLDTKAFHTLTYGLFVIASKLPDGRKVGCIANTFQQVASEPARCCVSLNKENTTTKAILESGRYTANVLTQDATMELIGVFGFHSSLETDKFADMDHELDSAEMPCLRRSCAASFSIRLEQTVDVGSHLLLIGTVEEARTLSSDEPPLTYAYYHEVLRGKTPPKAVSYQADDASCSAEAAPASQATTPAPDADARAGKPRYAWRCQVCGHIEYADELPDDFTCPVCGVGRELFERIEL